MLDIEHLSVRFGGASEAVSDISLSVGEKEKVVLVGETGSGKSVLLLAILQMLPASASVSGRALLDGTDLLTLSPREMHRIRGQRISYVPQGGGNGMNPLLSVGYQDVYKRQIPDGARGRNGGDRVCRTAGPISFLRQYIEESQSRRYNKIRACASHRCGPAGFYFALSKS